MEQTVGKSPVNPATLSKRRRFILFLIVFAGFGLGGYFVLRSSSPVPEYAGRPIDDYLVLLGKGSWRSKDQSLRVIRGAGPDYLPYYVNVGYGPRPWYAFRAGMLHQRFQNKVTAAINRWVNPDDLRRGARKALESFKHDDLVHSVTNDLADVLLDSGAGNPHRVASLINAFGGNAADLVVPWLGEPNSVRVRLACDIISDSGTAGSNAVPALVSVYQRNPEYAEDVFLTFKKIGDVSRPALAEAMSSEDLGVRKVALRVVRTDPAMLGHTVPMLTDPNPELRSAAALTIVGWRLSAENRETNAQRVDGFHDSFVRVVALEVGRAELLHAVEEIFETLSEFEQVRAATAYCLYAGTDNPLMRFLENRATSPHRSKRVEAEKALRSIHGTHVGIGESK